MATKAKSSGRQAVIELFSDQQEALDKVLAAYHKQPVGGKALVVAATGWGKTIFFSALIHALHTPLQGVHVPVLIVCHRDELLNQAREKYLFFDPQAHIGKVGGGAHQYGAPITVAGIDTISQPKHLKNLHKFGYKLVIWDECHHSPASNFQKVRAALPDAFHLGVTATPDRLDGKSLEPLFGLPVFSMTVIESIQKQRLCRVKGVAIRTETNLDEVGSRKNRDGEIDFNQDELAVIVDNPARNKRVVEGVIEHAPNRRAGLVFATSIKHAESLAYTFKDYGIPAAVVQGNTSHAERLRLYEALRTGHLKELCNVLVLTEGFDLPLIDHVVMARPTQSRSLYTQCLDTETQILTPDGWKSHNEIQQGDLVAGYDKNTEEIQWVPALSKVERSLGPDEKMYQYASPSLDFRVTGGHRMLYRFRTSSKGGKRHRTSWGFIEAQDLASKPNMYEVPIAGNQQTSGVPLTDDEIRFIGWFLTDGCLNKINNAISISQAAHQPYHEDIKKCLAGCGFKYGVYECEPKSQFNATSNSIRYNISKGTPRGRDKHLTGWARLEPYIDKNFSPALDDMTVEQLEILLETINMGDGNKQLQPYFSKGKEWTRRSYTIIKGNKTFAERLQSLCIRRGFKCNIAEVKNRTGICYALHIKKTTFRAIGGQNCADRPTLQISPSISDEIVWCIENELGTLVTRRNGKVTIMGNCVGRGMRLYPGKHDCLIIDLTDNSLIHRLTPPQHLSKMLDISMRDGEDILDALEREEDEKAERDAQAKRKLIRKLNEKRTRDIEFDPFALPDWQERDDGLFVMVVGPEKHRIALCPCKGVDGLYTVQARLAPNFSAGQKWSGPMPLDGAMQFAEKRARLLLAEPAKKKLLDRNEPWRNEPISDGLKKWLDWKKIPWTPEMTKGEACDLRDEWERENEEKKATKAARAAARLERMEA